jgi:hypothetical protein
MTNTSAITTALLTLGQLGVKGPAAAAWLRTVARVAVRTPKPDLVWSGPEVPGLYARDTRRVYEELLGSAERSIWASTYAFFDGPICMKNPTGTRRVKRPRIVKHTWMRRSGPVGAPKAICEFPHQLFGSGGVPPLALNVK